MAALAVLIYHAGEVVARNRLSMNDPSGLYAVTQHGYLGVSLFFVISGYCIAAAAVSAAKPAGSGVGKFILARLWRIYPTYWAALLFAFLMSLAALVATRAGILGQSVSAESSAGGFWTWLLNILLLHWPADFPSIVPVSWTLCYEVSFYAVMAIAVAVGRLWRVPAALTLCHGTTFVCCVIIALGRQPVFPFDLWPQFGVGILVYDLLTRPPGMRTKVCASTTALAMASVALFAGSRLGAMDQPMRTTFGVALAFSIVLLTLRKADASLVCFALIKRLQWLGVISYSLYLTHFPILGLTNQLSKRVIPVQFHLVQLLLSVAACIAFAAMFWRWIERPLTSREHVKHQIARVDEPSLDPPGIPIVAGSDRVA